MPRQFCACLAIATLGAACSPPGDSGGSRRPEATATILVGSEPAGVNELVSGGSRATQDLIDRLFLHLFEEQPDFRTGPPTFEPQLAESWSWSPDHRVLELHLRRGVLWSDGTEVTARDVRFTWEMQTDAAVGWRYADLKSAILDVEVTGRHRLDVVFARHYPAQLADLNEGVILPAHAWSELAPSRWPESGGWFRDHLVTNGPYRLSAWEPQQHVLLRRNPSFHAAGEPKIDRLLLRVTPLRRNRIEAIVNGNADFVAQLTPGEAELLSAAERVIVRRYWHRQYDFVIWNLRRPMLADSRVRQALTASLDRSALVDALWGGDAKVGISPILQSVWAFDDRLAPWPFDRRQAERRLQSAGWQRAAGGRWERNGEPFAFTLLVNAGNPIHGDAAELAAAGWERFGLEVEVARLDFQALIARLDAGDFDAAVGAWGIDTSLDLGYAFHSDAIRDGYNSGGYANPEVDRRIEALRKVVDLEEKRRLLHELQQILHADQPYTFLWEPPRYDAHSRRLGGVQPNALSSLFRARQWWLVGP